MDLGIIRLAVIMLGSAFLVHLWLPPPEPRDTRVPALERRIHDLETKEPPTCLQIHPEKFTIDIYPAPNLGKHPLPKKETP